MEAWSMVVMGRGCGVRMPGILLISGPSHFGPTIAFGEYCYSYMILIFHMARSPFETQEC